MAFHAGSISTVKDQRARARGRPGLARQMRPVMGRDVLPHIRIRVV